MGRPFTDQEVQVLIDAYTSRKGQYIDLSALAERLGRAKNTISTKARSLGLTDHRRPSSENSRRCTQKTHEKKLMKFSGLTYEEVDAFVLANYDKMGSPAMAKQLGCSDTCVTNRRNKLGLPVFKGTPVHSLQMSELAAARMKRPQRNPYSRTQSGKRWDLGGLFLRSRWEANYARYLNFLKKRGNIQGWKYEPVVFRFEGVSRGPYTYTPDFEVIEKNGEKVYHEVKGWMDSKSRGKLKRMRKFYPSVAILIIGPKEYREVAKAVGKNILHWEAEGRKTAPSTKLMFDVAGVSS